MIHTAPYDRPQRMWGKVWAIDAIAADAVVCDYVEDRLFPPAEWAHVLPAMARDERVSYMRRSYWDSIKGEIDAVLTAIEAVASQEFITLVSSEGLGTFGVRAMIATLIQKRIEELWGGSDQLRADWQFQPGHVVWWHSPTGNLGNFNPYTISDVQGDRVSLTHVVPWVPAVEVEWLADSLKDYAR